MIEKVLWGIPVILLLLVFSSLAIEVIVKI